jgi:hypothetical protein
VREPGVVVQTTSDIVTLDDGYKWRKCRQKLVQRKSISRYNLYSLQSYLYAKLFCFTHIKKFVIFTKLSLIIH